MPIAASDLLWKYSVTSGAAGNATAGTQAGSLGKYVSTTQPTDNVLNNWFNDVTAAENAALVVKYRLFFIHNNHATIAWGSPVVYLSAEVAGGVSVAISWDTTGVTAKGSSSAQGKTIANETTAPASQSFTAPTTIGTALALGANIPAGSVAGLWVRQTAANSAALDNDGVTLLFSGTT